MNSLIKPLALASVLMLSAGLATAQSTSTDPAQPGASTMTMSANTTPSAAPAVSMAPAAQPLGKTREEVYRELVRAQKDGTIERLNALYMGG